MVSLSIAEMCLQLLSTEVENEITLTAFRLLTMDLLILYHVMNEGTINVLGRRLVCFAGFAKDAHKP